MKATHSNVAAIIAERFVAELDKGVAPWAQGFVSHTPRNAQSGKAYRGINYFLLSMLGVDFAVTYKGAEKMGGNVKKGAKSIPVVFWRWIDSKTEKRADGKPKQIPFMRYYNVFRLTDCENVPTPATPAPGKDNERIATAETMFDTIQSVCGFTLTTGGNQPCFIPALNEMQMPGFDRWAQPARFYKTLFHECGHALGKKTGKQFSRALADYAAEELVAELFASVCLNLLGINSPDAWDNSLAYLQTWARRIGGEPQLIISAAQEAQKRLDLFIPRDDTATDTDETAD